jgi:hypothetical protein
VYKSGQEIQEELVKRGFYLVGNYHGAWLYNFSHLITAFKLEPDPACCGHSLLSGFTFDRTFKKEEMEAINIFMHIIPFMPAAPFMSWTLSTHDQKYMVKWSKAIGAKLLHEWMGIHGTKVAMFGIEKKENAYVIGRPSPETLAKFQKK